MASAAALLLVGVLVGGCSTGPAATGRDDTASSGNTPGSAPERVTIVPDDYHVPYAGTAEDGRRFFLSSELFTADSSYVGLFLWQADGTFDEVRIQSVARPSGLPPGQAGPAGADDVVRSELASLGDYVLESIDVEPFLEKVEGVAFGWRVSGDAGNYTVNIEPGDFIAYHEPWDGLGHDT